MKALMRIRIGSYGDEYWLEGMFHEKLIKMHNSEYKKLRDIWIKLPEWHKFDERTTFCSLHSKEYARVQLIPTKYDNHEKAHNEALRYLKQYCTDSLASYVEVKA